MRWWKILGLAGIVGVAATGVIVAREERHRRAYTPDEISHAGGEACVCDLTDAFELTGPTISHHLKVLREAGLVTSEKRATWVYYRAAPEGLGRLSTGLVPGEQVAAEGSA